MTIAELIRTVITIPVLGLFVFLTSNWRWPMRKTAIISGIATALMEVTYLWTYFVLGAGLSGYLLPFTAFLPVTALALVIARYRDVRALFCVFTATAMCMSGGVIGLLAGMWADSIAVNVIVTIVVYIMYAIFVPIFFRNIIFEGMTQIKYGWAALSAVPLAFLGASFFLTVYPTALLDHPENTPSMLFLIVFLLTAYVIIGFLFWQMRGQITLLNDRRVLKIQVTAFQNQRVILDEKEERLRIFNHDLRHYTRIMHTCMQSGDYDGAARVLESMDMMCNETQAEKRYCDNAAINAAISYYAVQAENGGATVRALANIPDCLPVEEVELAVIVSNCMENAVNACANIPEGKKREINLTAERVGEQFILEISNTYFGDIEFNKSTGVPITTGGEGHGIGTHSVAAFAAHHKAAVDYSVNDGWFNFRMVLHIPQDA